MYSIEKKVLKLAVECSSYILLIWNFSLSAPNFEETLMVVIKHGSTAETAISSVLETINSTTKHSYFLLANDCPCVARNLPCREDFIV